MKKRTKHIWKLAPCSVYNIECMQSWLEDMAADGLFLSEKGFRFGCGIFYRDTPKKMRYRLQAIQNKNNTMDIAVAEREAEEQELGAKYGWDVVATFGPFSVYATDREDARELNTDPQVQAMAFDFVRKRTRNELLSYFLFFLVVPSLFFHAQWILYFTAVNAVLALMQTVSLLSLLIGNVVRFLRTGKRYRLLKDGGTLARKTDWRKHARRNRIFVIADLAFSIILIVATVTMIVSVKFDIGTVNLSDYKEEIPFAVMRDFAPDAVYTESDSSLAANTIRVDSGLLSHKNISLVQSGVLARADGTSITGIYRVEYCEALSPAIAKKIAVSLRDYDRRQYHMDDSEFYVPNLSADYAVAYQTFAPTVVIADGDRVIHATFLDFYDGIAVDEWMRAVARSIQ